MIARERERERRSVDPGPQDVTDVSNEKTLRKLSDPRLF